jgi:prepilin-type N-terminal cleavage/methylation domain-containing protein/prepilin-type processing-associated H-X9-DG protein
MRRRYLPRRRLLAFTLVELIVVLAIISLLGSLAMPALQRAMDRARSMKCAGNLRSIGMAANLWAADNNNTYPQIDQAAAPIYSPQGSNIVTTLANYGITTNVVQCPVDMVSNPSSFSKYGSSYEWDPVFDSEPINTTVVYITPTVAIPINSSRVRLAMDFLPIHHGRPNVVYGDGHVSSH